MHNKQIDVSRSLTHSYLRDRLICMIVDGF